MAEFVMKHLVHSEGLDNAFRIASCAVSTEEIGNDVYPPVRRCLAEKGIAFSHRAARRITADDFRVADFVICMDRSNLRLLRTLLGHSVEGMQTDGMPKLSLLLDWTSPSLSGGADVADPWYTGDFETTYRDILRGCTALLRHLSPMH